jgi:predicted AAA+ superfamily ATPase
MRTYTRHIDDMISSHFKKYKEILILLGSRQCGKTTLVRRIFPDAHYLLADNEPVRKALESYDVHTYRALLAQGREEIIIDEMHQISDPGRAAKIIYDQLPVRLILTGSSSFHLKRKTVESLAGRKIDYHLFPLTLTEHLYQNGTVESLNFRFFTRLLKGDIKEETRLFDLKAILALILNYGLYPNAVNHPADERYLVNFTESLIFKDLVEMNLIESRKTAVDLLRLLAHQTGNIISYAELASQLGADQRTIKRYIEIFEQSFIVFRLTPFTGNRRNELAKSPKIYFYDTGIRNAIINNFSAIDSRPDRGALFENFIISECVKANHYLQGGYSIHYWRTTQKSEVDLVLVKADEIVAVEIKFNGGAFSRAFAGRYPSARTAVITSGNFF